MNRRKARENAFFLVFETEFQKDESDYKSFFGTAIEVGEIEYDEFTEKEFFGIMEHKETIDKKIGENSKGWKLERLSRTTVSIMRVCVYEMLYCDDIPYNVSINEAIELAKKYDHEKAPAFINGVVNKIAEKEGLKQ